MSDKEVEIKIENISVIELKPNEKLLVRLPDDTEAVHFQEVRKSILKFFNILPDRLLLYTGEVEFKKVKA